MWQPDEPMYLYLYRLMSKSPFVYQCMCILENSDDPDKMLHNAAFYQGRHCLLDKNELQRKKYNFYMEIIACDPLIYIMDHPKFIVSNQKEESIS